MLTQDPAMADPVCDKSPHHGVILDIVEKAQKRPDTVEARPLVFRNRKESKELARPF
jgi:pyrroloquinoline quinone biosynthesis protein E